MILNIDNSWEWTECLKLRVKAHLGKLIPKCAFKGLVCVFGADCIDMNVFLVTAETQQSSQNTPTHMRARTHLTSSLCLPLFSLSLYFYRGSLIKIN